MDSKEIWGTEKNYWIAKSEQRKQVLTVKLDQESQ